MMDIFGQILSYLHHHPSSPPAPSSSVSLSSNPSTTSTSSNNTGVIVGSVIGSLIGGSLTVGSFFLYKRYKNKKERQNAIPTPGEGIQIPRERTNYYYQNQQTPPQAQQIYNYGQTAIPITGNIQQNVDQNALQTLIAQAVREEVNNLRSPQYRYWQNMLHMAMWGMYIITHLIYV